MNHKNKQVKVQTLVYFENPSFDLYNGDNTIPIYLHIL